MAISFVVSYTFSPSTTISSSQVNTNTSDVASVFQGLEAKTKTFAALGVDALPTLSSDVATKSYVDKLNNYRHPVLQYSSGTAVNMETGINGTSGQAQILFPDGTLRTDSTTGRINLSISQVAALSGAAQSGLRTGSVANNTWYACYAVKVTDSSTNFVMVADTVLPLQANYSTLNSNFGTSGWVYLGTIRYGDQSGTANAIVRFVQSGNTVIYGNSLTTTTSIGGSGVLLATTNSASSLTWTYAVGTTGAVVPNHIVIGLIVGFAAPGGTGLFNLLTGNAGNIWRIGESTNAIGTIATGISVMPLADNLSMNGSASSGLAIALAGYIDPVLGIGANPIL